MDHSSEELTQMIFKRTIKELRIFLPGFPSLQRSMISEQVEGQEGVVYHVFCGSVSHFLTARFDEEHEAILIQLYLPVSIPSHLRKKVAGILREESDKHAWGQLKIGSRDFVQAYAYLELEGYRRVMEEMLHRHPDPLLDMDSLTNYCKPSYRAIQRIVLGLRSRLLRCEELFLPTMLLLPGTDSEDKSSQQGDDAPLLSALEDIGILLTAVRETDPFSPGGPIYNGLVEIMVSAWEAEKTTKPSAPDPVSKALALLLTERDEQGEDAATEE